MIKKLLFCLIVLISPQFFGQVFLPSNYSNLSLWLKADAGVTLTSGAVSQWADQSGNGYNASQSTLNLRPIQVTSSFLNSKPVIRFDGADDVLAGVTIPNINTDNMTLFVVSSGGSQSANMSGFFTVGTLASGLYVTRSISTTQAFRVWTNSNAGLTSSANSVPTSGYNGKLLSFVREVGVQGKLAVNGTQQASTTNATFLGTFTNAAYQIGKAPSYSTLNGDIAEIIVYNRILTSAEQIQVEKYLMDKYAPPVSLGADINDTYGFEDITLSSPGYYTNYSWSTGATSSTININLPGTYWVQTTDVFGRVSRDTINVTRPDYATVLLTNQVICYNGNTSVTAPIPTGDYTFVQWSDGVTTQTRSIAQTASLSYTLRDNTNFTRTSNSATFTFDNSLQNVRLGNDTSLCVGNTLQLQTTSPSITSYLWSTGATTSSIILSTSDHYRVEVTNSNGCSKRDTIQVTIIGQSPTIQFNFPTQFCQNESAAFSETSFVQSGEAIGSRLWNFGNSSSSNMSNGTFLNSVVGNYNGTLTVTSIGGCQSTQAFSYSVRPKPIANYTSPLLCDNVSGLFSNTSTAPSSTITASQWLVDEVLNASTSNLNYTHPTIGNFNLKLVVTNGFGCKDTSSQTQSVINNYPIPNAPSLIDPFNTKTVLSTEQIPFSWSSVADNYFYELQFSTSNSFSSILNSQTTNQTSLTTVLNNSGTIFWRVKANNPCLLGGTSQIFSLQSVAIADSLRLWLRADRGVTLNGSTVSAWADQSSNNLNATQSTAANQPIFVSSNPTLNGLSSLRFDGTNDLLNGGLIPRFGSNSLSVFMIASGGNQSTTNAAMLSSGTGTTGWWLTRRASAGRIGVINNNNTLQGTITSLPTAGYNFRLFGYNKIFGTSALLKVNGNNEISSTTAAAINGFTNANYQVGAGSGANFLNGDIAEVMVFTKTLSTEEQAGIEKYLMDKYTKPVNIGPDITSNYGFCDFTLTSNAFFESYLWSTNATTSSISINEPGIYWVQATDIFGRITRDTVVLARPHYAQIQLNNQLICYNNPQTINAIIPAGDYTFVQWNDGLTTPSRVQGQAQSIFYTLRDNQNCTKSSNTAIITIDNSLQAVRLGNDTSLCVGNSIQLAVSSPTITAYSWNTGNSNASQLIDTTGAYILTVSNSNGCIKRDTINITVLGDAPVLSFTVPSTVCLGSSLSYSESSTVNNSTISSVLWNFGNSQTSNQSAGQFNYSQIGDYTGSLLIQSDNGCSSSTPFIVSVKSLPIANFTTPLLCSNTEVTLTNTSTIAVNGGAINSQIWNIDNIQAANTNNLTYSFPSAGTYEVDLIVENQFGCRDTATQLVNTQAAFAIPSSTSLILPSDNISILANQAVNLVWNDVANNYFYTVEFSSSSNFSVIDFTTTSTVANLTYSPPNLGTYYWRVKTNNACLQGGISEVRAFTITSVSNTTLWLRGDSGVTTVSGAVSQWSDQSGNGNNAVQTTATTRPLIANSLQFNNLPIIRFDGSDDLLTGTTIPNLNSDNLTIITLNSGNAQSGNMAGLFTVGSITTGMFLTRSISASQLFRVWTNNATVLSSSANSAPTSGYTPRIVSFQREVGVGGRISVNGITQASTTNGSSMSIFTNANYQIGRALGYSTLNGDIAEVIVYNRILTATEQSQVEKYLMDKYAPPVNLGADINDTYGFEDITLSTPGFYTNYLWNTGATTASISVNNPGQYILAGTDVFGRVSRDTINVTRPDYATVQLTNQVICYNGNTSITAPIPSGAYTFVQWNDGVTTQTRSITQTASLSYTLRDNANFTRTSNTATFTFDNSLQNVTLGNDLNLCVGNTLQLQTTSPSITSYQWSTGATTSSIILSTSDQYRLEVTNSNGCSKRDTIQVTIIGQSPTIQFNFPTQFCQNESAAFSETSFVQSGEDIGSRLWNFGNSSSSNLSSGSFLNSVVGNYNGTLTVTSIGGCQSTQAFSYSVRPKPIANYTSPLLCDNVTGLFTNTSSAPSSTITASQWLVDDVLNASTSNLNYAHPTTGNYNLKLIVTNGFSCKDTSSQTQSVINTYPIPNAPSLIDPFNTKTVLSTEQIPFSWSSVANNYFYELLFSTTSDFASILSNQSTTQTNLTTATNTGGTVFWRVKANNPCLLGGTSQIFSLQSVAIADSLRLWLRADSGITLNGSTVSSWLDQSSTNLNATQTTAANQPTFVTSNPVLNGLPSVRFDGTNDLLNGGLIPRFGNNSLSVFAIASGGNQNTTNAAMLSSGTVTAGWWLTRRASAGRIGVINNNNTLQGTITSLPTAGYNFRLFGYNKIFGTSALLKVNGNNEISSTTAAAINGFTNANYQVGAVSGANFLNGDIAEMMVFTKTLSTDEQAGIEKYLMDKYTKPVNIGPDISTTYGFCDITLTSNAFFESYLWSTNATTSSISINEPGIYWVQATDIFGRVTRDTMILSRPYYSQIQLNNQLICYNDPQTINATIPAGDYTFVQWNDGLTTPSRVQGQAQSIFYTLSDNQNCTKSSNTAIITIDNSLQNVRLGNDTSLCVGNTIQLAVTHPAITTYTWNTGNSSASQLIDTAGTYILNVSNLNSCVKSDTINITVLGNAPLLAFTVPSTVCLGSSLSYSESSTVVNSTISSVLWNFGNGQTSNQSTGQFNYNQVGDYTGSLLVQSDNGCSSSTHFVISVKSLPIASFTVPLLCSNAPATFTNTSTIVVNGGIISSQIWNIDNLQVATTNNLIYSFSSSGAYEVGLIVENQFGCRDTATQLVNTQAVFAIPSATSLILPSDNITILANQAVSLVWNDVANNYFYTVEISGTPNFSLIDFITTTSVANLTYSPPNLGTYYWRVKTNNACLQGGISEVRAFTITSVSNTTLWLRGDAGVTTVSGAVSQWSDQSGNGNNAAQTTATARPLLTNSLQYNNLPVLRFDGTNDVLIGNTIPNLNSDNLTVFVLNSGNSQTGNMSGLFTVGSFASGMYITRSINSTQAFRVWTNNTLGLTSSANSAPTAGYSPKIVAYSRQVGVLGRLFVNGVQQASSSNANIINAFTNANYRVGFATDYSGLNGDIAEVIVYNRILTDTEQAQVEKYLMDKYAPPVNLGADITSNYGFCDSILTPTGYFVNYLWSNGATTSNLAVNNPGTYWVRATDIFGRISSDTINVVRPVYDSIALQNRIVCYNALIEETAYVPTGYSFVNWNDGNTNQTRLLNQNESLSYTIADNRNCQLTSNNALITIDSSLFAISLGNDTSLCVGNTIQLQLSSPAISGYSWNTGITTATQQLDTTGLYILQVQNVNNCFQRDSIFITIIGNSPVINYSFPTESCQFDEVQFSQSSTVQGSTIETTTWTIGNNAPILASSSQFIFNQPQVIPISLEVISASNCRSIANFSITVWPKPIVNFSTENFCPYQEITFNPSNQVNTQLQSFDWNFGQAASATNTSQLANPTHLYGIEGNYSVNLKIVDEHGCKDTVIQNVLIQPAPISSFSVQNTCENTTVEFTNTSSIPVGYSIQTNLWNYGDNTSATNPTTGKEYAAYGDYVIELITVGNNGCSDTSSQSITVFPNPILNWSITPSCKNTLTVFEDLSTIPEGTLVSTDWLVNLQYPFTTTSASYRFATLGVQYLNLTSTSDQGCTSDTLIIVNVNPELDARFTYSPSIVVAGVPVTFNDLSIGSTSSTWDLGKGESLINYTPPIDQFTTTYTAEWIDSLIDVTLFVENQFGCKDTLTKSFGVISPAFDLAVKSIFIQEINGFNTVGVEFENVGTISINKIDFELSGLNTLPIQETWNGTLLPNQDQIYMFNAKLSAYNSTQDELTNFLCVEGFASDVIGNVDVIKINDKVCENTENEELALLSIAPNPTESATNVSLLIPNKTDVTIINVSLYSMKGDIVQYVLKNQNIDAGIFDFSVDLTNVQRGIYLLKIEDGTTTKVIRLSKI